MQLLASFHEELAYVRRVIVNSFRSVVDIEIPTAPASTFSKKPECVTNKKVLHLKDYFTYAYL